VGGLVTVASEWRVMQRATVALLDEQFADRVCRVSGLTAALLGRAFQRVRWFAFHAALAQVRRAEPRLLLLLRTPARQSVPAAATRPVLRADDPPALRLALALERVTAPASASKAPAMSGRSGARARARCGVSAWTAARYRAWTAARYRA
jgi:hypothetical protein